MDDILKAFSAQQQAIPDHVKTFCSGYYPSGGNTSAFNIVVGRLLCRHMRDILVSEQFVGRKIRWLESKGLIERMFTVTGEATDVWAVAERITAWARNVNAVDYH